VLADRGLGSRRQIETWVREGRVRVNGKPAVLGQKLVGQERVEVDGRLLPVASRTKRRRRIIALNKPVGCVTTRHDPEGRPTVFDSLPRLEEERWIAVGRLDLNTQGLLLLTTDGELANRLMHPSHAIEREYAVRVLGPVDQTLCQRLQHGVELDGERRSFDSVTAAGGSGANQWYHVVLREGRNREVRRLWESQGVRVSRLIRVRYGSVRLERNLPSGRYRDLDEATIRTLMKRVGLANEVPEPRALPAAGRRHQKRVRGRTARHKARAHGGR
jgi:23S rRNA pseudouridine2605 synthase